MVGTSIVMMLPLRWGGGRAISSGYILKIANILNGRPVMAAWSCSVVMPNKSQYNAETRFAEMTWLDG
ncbi:hypothetical protein A1355_12475 [Methylomonas koyamae]|uniref:Uncharacterized protein n=1 Tax=Methylomonas koyamae TaxID=702114 RepID=A0A177N979_9GAMM|nr:hypothetical protein A1355_12475 [Methylomonas koyamae]